jgi:hypothetical protein
MTRAVLLQSWSLRSRVHISGVTTRMRLVLVIAGLMLGGCSAWAPMGNGAGRYDIHDVSGDSSKPDERDLDLGEDQAQAGLRFSDEGTIDVGGTEEGEIGVVEEPSDTELDGDTLIPPVELPDEPL